MLRDTIKFEKELLARILELRGSRMEVLASGVEPSDYWRGVGHIAGLKDVVDIIRELHKKYEES